jgi:endonuclease YncB( thermonuclease family)
MRVVAICLLASIASVGAFAAPTASAAKRVPCVIGEKGGPKCSVLEARVKWSADGDTVKPKIRKGNKWLPKRPVRMTGIQAMELYNYSRRSRKGECMAVEAAEALDKLVHGQVFRLVSMRKAAGGGARGRLRSTLQVKKGGRWIDPAMVLLEKGLVLWNPDGDEWAWNEAYSGIAQEAASRGVGIWNPEACKRPGPSQNSPLKIKVKWNGGGHETANSEWVRITNQDPFFPVSLAGWRLRDASARSKGVKDKGAYKFPADAVIPAGGSVIVRVGRGTNGNGTFYWGLAKPLFQNVKKDKRMMGDGVYLFDPQLEMRAHVQYPCRTSCADPLAGKVNVTARYEGATYEWITVSNGSGEPISLDGYEMESVPWFYEFGPADVLAPGQALVLFRNKADFVPVTDARAGLVPAVPGRVPFLNATIFRNWGHTEALFGDKSDIVTLRNPLGAPVICHAWGGERCPNA